MKRFWPLLFLGVPVLGVWLFVKAAATAGWWLPVDVSTYGHRIDGLFNIILWITGITFIATEGLLVWFLFRYAGTEGGRGLHIHGHHKTEIVWTIVPACILVFIAIVQLSAWTDIKFKSHFPKDTPPFVEITAGQFEWRLRYAGVDRKLGTADDVFELNELHVPVNEPIIIHLKSRDVLHSFFVRELRLKQDAVPGMTIPVWFQAKEPGEWDLMCAELCGWGHYKMKGRLFVHDRPKYDAWLAATRQEQERAE